MSLPVEFDPILVHEWLRRSAARLPEKTALVCGTERWSYRMLDTASSCLAAHLIRSGFRRGDRLAVFLENSAEIVVSIYAAMKAGGIFVVLDPTMQPPKLRAILSDLTAQTLVIHGRRAASLSETLASLQSPPLILWVRSSGPIPPASAPSGMKWEEAIYNSSGAGADHDGLPPGACLDVDLACLIYTSGSTGTPKGIMCTHHNVVAACRSIIQYLGNRETDVVLCALPLSFDYGLYQVLMSCMYGGTVILESGFVYPHQILSRIRSEGVTGLPIVPSMLAIMMRLDDLAAYGIDRLRYITNTGSRLNETHVRRFRSLFPKVAFYSMFGLSECKRVSYLPPEDIDRLFPSVGRAMPNCEVQLVDEEGNEVPENVVGEMIVLGSNVMQGYWRDPEGSGEVFRPGAYPADRRLHTGDYFHRDADGRLFFHGRKDDLIKCRGERVSPREIESAILQTEGIVEAAARGVPDEIDGQAIVAFVVAAPGSGLTERKLREHCSRRLESSRVPRHIRFVDRIPRNERGKIEWARLPMDGLESASP